MIFQCFNIFRWKSSSSIYFVFVQYRIVSPYHCDTGIEVISKTRSSRIWYNDSEYRIMSWYVLHCLMSVCSCRCMIMTMMLMTRNRMLLMLVMMIIICYFSCMMMTMRCWWRWLGSWWRIFVLAGGRGRHWCWRCWWRQWLFVLTGGLQRQLGSICPLLPQPAAAPLLGRAPILRVPSHSFHVIKQVEQRLFWRRQNISN